MKTLFTILFLIMANDVLSQNIVINEVQYGNKSTLTTTDGETPDWIEIYNADTVSVLLQNFKLTDDTSKSAYWNFPNVKLPPGNFILVFASGKNLLNGDEIHTDFKLKVMEESVFLLNKENAIVDKINAQCVPTDKSIGRNTDGEEELVVFNPTPGTSNNNATPININFKPDVLKVSNREGFYANSLKIDFTNNHANNKIYYTLNGDEPDTDAIEFIEDFYLYDANNNKNRFANKVDIGKKPGNHISKASIVRAKVFSEGCPASNEITNTYFIKNGGWNRYNVPMVSIVTESDNLFDDEIGIYTKGKYSNHNRRGKEWERPAHIEMYDSANKLIVNQDMGLRLHGRASRGAAQKSFRLYAREEYGTPEFNFPFFPQKPHLKSFKTLLLRSTEDWSGTLVKDELGNHIIDNMNLNYTACRTVLVYVNGEYWGIYSLRERLDEHWVANNYGIQTPELDIISHDPGGLKLEEGSFDAYNSMLNWLENADVHSSSFYTELSARFDIEGMIDYYIAQLYLANTDFPHNNLKLWRQKSDTAKWRYFYFDLDAIMTRVAFDHLSEYNNTLEKYDRYPDYSIIVFQKVIKNETFRAQFNARFRYHISNTFVPDKVLKLVNHYQDLYEPLVGEHIYRWNNPKDVNKWLHNIDILKTFALQRPSYVNQYLLKNLGNPFRVFPNPSQGSFHIENITANDKISIFNLQGKLSWNSKVYEQEAVNVPLAKGIYILQIQSGRNLYNEKIIIE